MPDEIFATCAQNIAALHCADDYSLTGVFDHRFLPIADAVRDPGYLADVALMSIGAPHLFAAILHDSEAVDVARQVYADHLRRENETLSPGLFMYVAIHLPPPSLKRDPFSAEWRYTYIRARGFVDAAHRARRVLKDYAAMGWSTQLLSLMELNDLAQGLRLVGAGKLKAAV